MNAFPFTQDEWNAVKETVEHIVDATLCDDDTARDSWVICLQSMLSKLRERTVIIQFCQKPKQTLFGIQERESLSINMPSRQPRKTNCQLSQSEFHSLVYC